VLLPIGEVGIATLDDGVELVSRQVAPRPP
jgi:hypothetical protein